MKEIEFDWKHIFTIASDDVGNFWICTKPALKMDFKQWRHTSRTPSEGAPTKILQGTSSTIYYQGHYQSGGRPNKAVSIIERVSGYLTVSELPLLQYPTRMVCSESAASIKLLSILSSTWSIPFPKPTDMFATLAGRKIFSELDLMQAYQQLHLDEDSKKYTMVTHIYNSIPDYHLI